MLQITIGPFSSPSFSLPLILQQVNFVPLNMFRYFFFICYVFIFWQHLKMLAQ